MTQELSRRTFVKGMTASSVSVVALAGCNAEPPVAGDSPQGSESPALRIEEYPRARVAPLDEIDGEPIPFDYPLEGQTNFVVKLGERANGGVGPDRDVVSFNYACTHMGCSLEGKYNDEHNMLGACPCHLSRFDLTNYGMVVTGHATQSLPQVVLDVEEGDVFATGIMGIVYGYRDNLKDGQPSESVQQALASGGGTATATPSAESTPSSSGESAPVDGYLDDVSNFDGSVSDLTGESEVAVVVGASGNNGQFAFAPPAVRVTSGTTVVWEWNGKGGQHNVVAEDGSFESDLVAERGHTFRHTFEESGTFGYFCRPHESLGMKGAVIVE